MSTRNTGESDRDGPDRVLENVERRVRKVQHLDPFRFDRREDGRFRCELEKPIGELGAEEIRNALDVLGTLTSVLEARLEEIEEE